MEFKMENKELKEYLFDEVLSKYYTKEDICHGYSHISEVITYAIIINNKLGNIVDNDLLITACVYHDTGSSIDRANHNIVSGNIVRTDERLLTFLCEDDIELVAMACIEHRASNSNNVLSSTLSTIVADADSCDGIMDIGRMIQRSNHYNKNIEDSYRHLSGKYGKEGYSKYYLQETSDMIKTSRNKIRSIVNDKERFMKIANMVLSEND